MCGVMVVDAGRSQSTNLGRDAYIYDHCLGYRHNYFLFYQLPNTNLFTHRMLFSREKPLVKSMPPGLSFIIFPLRFIFIHFYLQIYYSKNPKIPCCTFVLLILFRVLLRAIYPIYHKFIYLFTMEGLTTPLTRQVASICSLCACTIYIVLLGSPTCSISLVSSLREILILHQRIYNF